MKLWTLVIDSDSGTDTHVFTTEAARDVAAYDQCKRHWDAKDFGRPMPDDWNEAWDVLSDSANWWLSVDEHDVDGICNAAEAASHRTFLDLSTANLMPATFSQIEKAAAARDQDGIPRNAGLPYCLAGQYGAMVWVPTDGEWPGGAAVPDLARALRVAREQGCAYVMFDCDAQVETRWGLVDYSAEWE